MVLVTLKVEGKAIPMIDKTTSANNKSNNPFLNLLIKINSQYSLTTSELYRLLLIKVT
jgi:hypothetical protein